MHANNSPWLEALDATRAPCPLDANARTDVAVIGAGIAGVATSFFLLRYTRCRVLLVERDRLARGATGYNAGQIASYFERPLCELVDSFGFKRAIAAQRDLDGAWDLLDEMVEESGAGPRIERFLGHMGIYSLNHLSVHPRNNLLRVRGGLETERCRVANIVAGESLPPSLFDPP